MPAMKVYNWSYIAPGATVNLYLHGFPNNWASTFSAVVYALSGQAYYPLGSINLTLGVFLKTQLSTSLYPLFQCSLLNDLSLLVQLSLNLFELSLIKALSSIASALIR
jgi:hypothetical protein